jgi:FKBP-type peptidyl-prolyl cis-trans isomerase FklB
MKISKSIVYLSFAAIITSCNAQDKKSSSSTMKTEIDSVSYGLGVSVGENLKKSNFENLNFDLIAKGMSDFYAGKPGMTAEQANNSIRAFMAVAEKKKGEENVKKGQSFLDENKKKEGVKVTASGLQYSVIKEGTGAKPTINDNVTTHYHGTLIDGTVFDSSVDRGQPASFPVSGVIPGWTEALQMMAVGSKYKLFVPSNLAYGDRGAGPQIGPNTTLIFEVELISIDAKDAAKDGQK